MSFLRAGILSVLLAAVSSVLGIWLSTQQARNNYLWNGHFGQKAGKHRMCFREQVVRFGCSRGAVKGGMEGSLEWLDRPR